MNQMRLLFRSIASVICLSVLLPQALSGQLLDQPTVKVDFRCAENIPGKGLIQATVRQTNQKVYLHTQDVIRVKDILWAGVVESNDEESYVVDMAFTKEGANRMARITKDCMKKNLAVLIDGQVISLVNVNSQIEDQARIFGALSKGEAYRLVNAINCCDAKTQPDESVGQVRHVQTGRIDIEFRAAEIEPGPGLNEAIVKGTEQRVYLHKEPIITNREIIEARVLGSFYGDFFEVEITLSKEGTERMTKVSQERKGKPLAILIDGEVISAPIVISEIHDKMKINGAFTKDVAERIAKRLNKR